MLSEPKRSLYKHFNPSDELQRCRHYFSFNLRNRQKSIEILYDLNFQSLVYTVAESKGKLPQLFVPSKTATLVPEFAVEDLPLGRTAALVPDFAVKVLGQNTLMMCIHSKKIKLW